MQIWPDTLAGLHAAASVLRAGGLVAFPTETVYGLGANAWNESAVRRVFEAKGRPADNPLIVHVAGTRHLEGVVQDPATLPQTVRRAMEVFWPGPLTLLLPAHPRLAPSTHPMLPTVGVRMPNHPVALALLEQANCPVAAPSANKSGRPSPTLATDVVEDLGEVIAGVIDGGPSTIGVESTVVAVGIDHATIYRPGGVSAQQLEDALSIPVSLDAHLLDPTSAPRAPGMKYRHYAPAAEVMVFIGDTAAVEDTIVRVASDPAAAPAAIIAPEQVRSVMRGSVLDWWPEPGENYTVALSRELYRLLRAFDRAGAKRILIAGVDPMTRDAHPLALAVMNRLEKAAAGRIVRV